MIEGIRNAALKAGIVDQIIFDKGIQDLYRTTEADGVFCYTFFKAFAAKKWDGEQGGYTWAQGPGRLGIFWALGKFWYLASFAKALAPGKLQREKING